MVCLLSRSAITCHELNCLCRYLAAYANDDPRLAFLSFPWIVWELLGRLKRQAFLARHADAIQVLSSNSYLRCFLRLIDVKVDSFSARLKSAVDEHCERNLEELLAIMAELDEGGSAVKRVLAAYFTR